MALRGLERDGLVAARSVGRTRLYQLNPRYFARDELQRYLLRLAEGDAGLRRQVADFGGGLVAPANPCEPEQRRLETSSCPLPRRSS